MSILDLINAAYNTQYVYSMYNAGQKIAPGSNVKGANSQKGAVPSFGLKMRAPLTNDKFESSQSQGQKMYNYNGRKMTLAQAQEESYREVDAHEQAHLSAAGQYAASGKVINFNGDGIAVSGHVNIKMPHLDKSNPDETIKHAKQVMVAAKAPESFSELSDADLNVYAKASATLAQAESFKAQQSKNPFAKNPFEVA